MEMQLDMFSSTQDDYLFHQIETLKYSMDKRFRAIFALMTEDQKEILNLKSQLTTLLEKNEANCSFNKISAADGL